MDERLARIKKSNDNWLSRDANDKKNTQKMHHPWHREARATYKYNTWKREVLIDE
jgi:hypothetical protein